jgi:hypothetical protein
MERHARVVWSSLVCLVVVGCGGVSSSDAPASSQGSVRIASSSLPPGAAGQFQFSGATNGTSQASHQACELSGESFRHFTVTADGQVAGRHYFVSVSVYPYRGAGAYDLLPLPPELLDYLSTPNPLLQEAPGGYPGFLNFVPKSEPGNAFGDPARSEHSTMNISADEHAGGFDLQLVSLNQKAGAPHHLRVTGSFLCGPPFVI